MAETQYLALPVMEAGQSQKHVTFNEAMQILDAAVQVSVKDRDLTAPPGGPAEGDRYLVAAGATGVWAGWDGDIAGYLDGVWTRVTVSPGWVIYVEDEDRPFIQSVGSGLVEFLRAGDAYLLADGSVAAPALAFSSDPDLGLYRIGANAIGISAGNSEQARFTSGGSFFPTLATFNNTILISSAQPTFVLEDTDAAAGNKRWRIDNVDGLFSIKTRTDAGALVDSAYQISRDAAGTLVHTWSVQGGNSLSFNGNTLDLNGSGTTAADFTTTAAFAGLYLNGSNSSRLVLGNTTDSGYNIEISGSYADEIFRIEVAATSTPIITASGFSTPEYLKLHSNGTEKMRVYQQGVLVAKTAENINTVGIEFVDYGAVNVTRDAGLPMTLNRKTNDGGLISFFAQDVFEGNITVAGATVSYNNFLGSHYSELDGAPAQLLLGTIVEATGNLVRDRFHRGERLTRFKVSDAAGSSAVYGVVGGAYYEDEDFVDEEGRSTYPAAPGRSQRAMSEGRNPVRRQYQINAVGAGHVRIAAGQTIAVGDLIESAGDGTGRVQADDLVRSSTVGKITSTHVVESFPDGSTLHPCVLYCG